MVHEMKLKDIYFEKIKSGQKIYEVRLNDEKRQQIDVGDVIIFKKEPQLVSEIKVLVKDLIYFNSFEEMADTLPPEKIGFSNSSTAEILSVYRSFYSLQDEQKYGVVAIKISMLESK